MNGEPPMDPDHWKTPLTVPVTGGIQTYDYVEDLEDDVITGMANLSYYSDMELEQLKDQLLGSPAYDRVTSELQQRRAVPMDDPPIESVQFEAPTGSAGGTSASTSSEARGSSDSDDYIDGYSEGYESGYQE
ncbi:hypothetical protein [Haloarchaeobius sp. DYHT-AS-18]|uniref:hypothetical protein n=1 Tax=Haloarchaeobius sp. DYHT-AS-18 TaxID=3446117 RepID=UPI003EBF746D